MRHLPRISLSLCILHLFSLLYAFFKMQAVLSSAVLKVSVNLDNTGILIVTIIIALLLSTILTALIIFHSINIL